MSYTVKLLWKKSPGERFSGNQYSRAHHWHFDGGTVVRASSSPDVVPVPMSDPSAVDPEEAFIASVSSCHMLFFLSVAAGKKFAVATYEDNAEGTMGKNGEGRIAMTDITLRPRVTFVGPDIPSPGLLDRMHQLSHAKCFLASSIKTAVHIKPLYTTATLNL